MTLLHQLFPAEVGVSPTKLHGKGSKRKLGDLDEDDSGEEDPPTWVEVLSKELPDEGSEDDPDYEVCTTFLCGHILKDFAPFLISFWSSCKESKQNVKGVNFLTNA